MGFDTAVFVAHWPLLVDGLGLTLAASALGLVLAVAVGVIVAAARLSRSRAFNAAATAYIEFVRNIPFMVLLFLIFYVLPAYGLRLPAFMVGVIGLGVHAGGYFAEIIRGAILSVPKGQMESARAIGMSHTRALRHVIFPQMMGYFIPPATSQVVMIVKESSILSTITVTELTMAGQVIMGYTYAPIEIFVILTVIYWVICNIVSRVGTALESALQPYRRRRTAAAVVPSDGLGHA